MKFASCTPDEDGFYQENIKMLLQEGAALEFHEGRYHRANLQSKSGIEEERKSHLLLLISDYLIRIR